LPFAFFILIWEVAMAKVQDGDTVSLHYTGTLDDGTVFDTSESGQPLSFTVGSGEVIQGFEEGVRGMEVGETRDISIEPDRAYGEYYEELVRVVPREAFPPNVTPAIGMGFELELPSGQTLPVRIIDIEGEEVTLDANHLLAGETLNFNIRLLSVGGSAQAQDAQ
jgi:peptidylprolyl isomerase